MSESFARRLRDLAVAVLVIAILAGLFVPIYTDETGWRFQERAGFDGVDKLYSDVCGTNTLARPAWFMWPVRLYSALFNGAFADPFYVRLSGVLYALAVVGLLLALMRRIADSASDRVTLGTLAAGMLSLGMMPFLMVWSRPEQPILLCLMGALMLGANGVRGEDTEAKHAWRRVLVLAALWIVAVSYHLKALFLFPVFAVCLVCCARGLGGRLPKLAAGGVILAVTAGAASYWLGRLSCPDDAILREAFAANSVGAMITGISSASDSWKVALAMLGNIKYFGYVMLLTPDPEPLSTWLPNGQISRPNAISWYGALLLVWGVALAVGVYGLVKSARAALASRRLDTRLVLALACIVSFTGWSATQNWSNVYETPFALSLALLAILLSAAAMPRKPGERTILETISGLLAGLAVINLVLLAMVWAPAMARAFAQEGYIAEQFSSVSIRGYAKIRPRIMQTAKICGIPGPEQAQGVLVDELTYFAYMESRLPQHRIGVIDIWLGKHSDPVAYLKTRNSDGILVGCKHLDPALRARARQHGEFCCLAPPDW